MPLFCPYNAATRFLKAQTSNYIADKKKPVERIYELLLYIRLFAGTPYGRVNDAGARLLHSVGYLYVRAGAAVSGCFCGCCDRSDRPPGRSAASGQQVRRYTVSRSGVRAVRHAPVRAVSSLPSARALSPPVRPRVVRARKS